MDGFGLSIDLGYFQLQHVISDIAEGVAQLLVQRPCEILLLKMLPRWIRLVNNLYPRLAEKTVRILVEEHKSDIHGLAIFRRPVDNSQVLAQIAYGPVEAGLVQIASNSVQEFGNQAALEV